MNDYLSDQLIDHILSYLYLSIKSNKIMRSTTNNNEIFIRKTDDYYAYVKNISDQTNEMYDLYHIATNMDITKKAYRKHDVLIDDKDNTLQFNGQITDDQVKIILSKCDEFKDKFNGNINIYRCIDAPDIFVTNDNNTVLILYDQQYYDAYYHVYFYKNSAIWYKNNKDNWEESYDVYDVDGKMMGKHYYENHKNKFKQY